jgi:hypothetical protein
MNFLIYLSMIFGIFSPLLPGIIRDENSYSESPFDMINMSEPGLMTTAVQVSIVCVCVCFVCVLYKLVVIDVV